MNLDKYFEQLNKRTNEEPSSHAKIITAAFLNQVSGELNISVQEGDKTLFDPDYIPPIEPNRIF